MSPLKRLLFTLALTAMWSPSFLFIKFAVAELPPMTIAASRITLSFILLFALLRWKRTPLPKSPRFWLHATVVGLVSTALPFSLFCYAEQSIDSSLAAMLNGSSPMFTALLAQLFIPSDRLNLQKGIGIAFCGVGLMVLFAPNLLQGVGGTGYGMLAGVLAAISYAIHHVYGKKYITGYAPFVAPTASLLMAALLLWPAALWNDGVALLPLPSFSALGGVCGLALFGTVIAFIIYYKLLEESGPVAISLASCLFPLGGIVLGVLFLDENLTVMHLVAAALILLGMTLVNQIIKLPFISLKAPIKQESSD